MTIAGFGELLLRLSPPRNEIFLQSPLLRVYVGGAEANVIIQLARLGHHARMISALPHGEIGDGALGKLRERGVDTSGIVRADGRMGLYVATDGAGPRPARVTYDRLDTVFQGLGADDWPWEDLLAGVEQLHVTGISAALTERTEKTLRHAIAHARQFGIQVSFDCNFRQSLWERRGCDPRPVLVDLISQVDFLFGNQRDISLLAGRTIDGDSDADRRNAAEMAFEMFPGLSGIASTVRGARAADRYTLAARLDRPGWHEETGPVELSGVVDRVGTGDAFAAGIIDGLAGPSTDIQALETGLALAALKHFLPGDAGLFGRADINAFAAGGFDISR